MTEAQDLNHEAGKPPVEILRAIPEDAEAICDVRDRAWLDTYPNPELGITVDDILLNAKGKNGEFTPRRIAHMKSQFAKDDGTGLTTLVAKVNGVVVGFVEPQIDETSQHRVDSLYVDPTYQGGGIGSVLMENALSLLGREHDIYLDVVSYNERAIGFYKKHGFVVTDAEVPEDTGRPDYMKSLPKVEMVLQAKTD